MSKQQSSKTATNEAATMPAHILAILGGQYALKNSELNSPQTKAVNTKQKKIKEAQAQFAPVTIAGETVTHSTLAQAIEEGEELETHDINAGDNTLISIE